MRKLILALLILTTGCAKDLAGQKLPLTDYHDLNRPVMQYLGVGGWLIQWKDEDLLLAPSFTNPSFLRSVPIRTVADHAKIDWLMPKARNITMILIGHGHYDHLLDVPWIMQRHAKNAKAYGSQTVGNLIGRSVPGRFVNAEGAMAKVVYKNTDDGYTTPGTWIYSTNRRFRAMPIESQHAPHLFGITFFGGPQPTALSSPPSFVWQWKEGQTLAWLIDLLDENQKPIYRIHYQDSASRAPYGIPPLLGDNKGIDVVILCVGSWENVPPYPDDLLRVTRPRVVVMGHWEDFFGNDPANPQTIPLTDEPAMVRAVLRVVPTGTPVLMPTPFSEVEMPQPTELSSP